MKCFEKITNGGITMPVKSPANGIIAAVITFEPQIKITSTLLKCNNHIKTCYLKLILVSNFILRRHIGKI